MSGGASGSSTGIRRVVGMSAFEKRRDVMTKRVRIDCIAVDIWGVITFRVRALIIFFARVDVDDVGGSDDGSE